MKKKQKKRNLDALFKPKGIAVIGASRDPNSVGYGILKNIKHPNAAKLFLGWLGSEGFKYLEEGNKARCLPFGDTYTAKLFKGKKMSWTPTPEQLPDTQDFFRKAIKALGVPR